MLVLVVALEKLERSSGSLVGNSIASIQKSTAPEVIYFTFCNSMRLTITFYKVQERIIIYSVVVDATSTHG